jgi:pyrroline-5-carboxylate reductase
MNILFIGGGKMMQAITLGLLARGTNVSNIRVVEPDANTRMSLQQMGVNVIDNPCDAIDSIDVVILAVKPQVMREALQPLTGKLSHQFVLSIAAGIRTRELSAWLNFANVIRAMPNTPALIQAGISGLYAAASVDATSRNAAQSLLDTVGKTFWVADEAMLDAVTAVSGSGPAYVFYVIEALEAAALNLGFDPPTARMLALETFRGASLLAAQSTDAPATLRANVTSKRGTTEAAISVFDAEFLQMRFIKGVTAAAKRAAELGNEFADTNPLRP